MSNTITYNDKMAFHPGYYLEELLEESELTQEDKVIAHAWNKCGILA